MEYEQIEIKDRSGRIHSCDCAKRLGEVAIVRSEWSGWCIVYLETVTYITFTFPSAAVAEVCAVELNKIIDWRGLAKSVVAGVVPNYYDEVVKICQDHGGQPITHRTSIKELQRTLQKQLAATKGGA